MEKTGKRYLSSTEVSEKIGLPVQAIRRLAREGRIPSYKFAGKHLFRIEEVIAAIENHEVKVIDADERSSTVESVGSGTH